MARVTTNVALDVNGREMLSRHGKDPRLLNQKSLVGVRVRNRVRVRVR